MGTWKNALFLQENLHVHKIPPFRGGGFFGGGSADIYLFILYGREDFLICQAGLCHSLPRSMKTPVPIKFLLLGGGGGSWFFWKGGVEVPILFLWAWGLFRPKTAFILVRPL